MSLKNLKVAKIYYRGGLSNQLYYCALPENLKARGREPTEVLLRMFGKHLSGPASDSEESAEYFVAALVLENVIFTLLSERDLGPKLYGVFAGGRLEEFIQVSCIIHWMNVAIDYKMNLEYQMR